MTDEARASLAQRVKGLIFMRGLREASKDWYRRRVFRRAMRQFIDDPETAFDVNSDLLRRLIFGWGNTAYSADAYYLVASLKATHAAKQPVLECGSGLSTLLAGVVAQHNGNTVWTLEHHPFWAGVVRTALNEHGIRAVELDVSPLRQYGEYDWYDPRLDAMPDQFAAVLCDGPPGNTRGGRYGCLPVMRSRLAPGGTILIDDAIRQEERDIAARWADSLGTGFEVQGEPRPYIRIQVPN